MAEAEAVGAFEIPVTSADGATSTLTLYRPEASDNSAPATDAGAIPTVLCLPAMGVRAIYYGGLARALARSGLPAATLDLRGLGTSSLRAGWHTDFGYHEMVELDLPAAVAALRAERAAGVVPLGHSLGGQLACLAAAVRPGLVDGIVLVASCSVYHRAFGPFRGSVLFLLQAAAWLSSRIVGAFPGRWIGFGYREARRQIGDWCRQGRTGRYVVARSQRDFEAALGTLDLPLLAISFADDGYAPPPAVDHLLAKMPSAYRRHEHLRPTDLGAKRVGHFSWVHRGDALAPRIAAWLADRGLGGPVRR